VTFIYKPIGLVLGLLAAVLGNKVFNYLWSRVDDEDPPKPTTQEVGWPKLLVVAAAQGMVFRVIRVVVDREGAKVWHYLTGAWPGERRPEPKP